MTPSEASSGFDGYLAKTFIMSDLQVTSSRF
jgi:hypothetical protein